MSEEELIRLQAKIVSEEKLKQAQSMSPTERFKAGAELFEEACQRSLAGIRFRNPGISEADAQSKLSELIALTSPN
ncbi:MAG: hypothetical protein AAGC74_08570 [Verrucomicrobiota bacterium]